MACTVFAEARNDRLPIRFVIMHLDAPDSGGRIEHKRITSVGLFDQLAKVARILSPDSEKATEILRTRVTRLYTTVTMRRLRIPTVVLVKPDQVRYWTRSAGLRDGDEIAADVLIWSTGASAEARSSVQ